RRRRPARPPRRGTSRGRRRFQPGDRGEPGRVDQPAPAGQRSRGAADLAHRPGDRPGSRHRRRRARRTRRGGARRREPGDPGPDRHGRVVDRGARRPDRRIRPAPGGEQAARHPGRRAAAGHGGLGRPTRAIGYPQCHAAALGRGLAGGAGARRRRPGRGLAPGLQLRQPVRRFGPDAGRPDPADLVTLTAPPVQPADRPRAGRQGSDPGPEQARPAPRRTEVGPPENSVYVVPTLLGAAAVLAGSSALSAAVKGSSWVLPLVEVVAVVWLVGIGGRLIRVPSVVTVLLQVLGLTIALTALFTTGGYGGVIPNLEVFREFGALLSGAWHQILVSAPP